MLTLGERVRDDVLQRLQGGVSLERLGDVLGALSTDGIGPHTARERQKERNRRREKKNNKKWKNLLKMD